MGKLKMVKIGQTATVIILQLHTVGKLKMAYMAKLQQDDLDGYRKIFP